MNPGLRSRRRRTTEEVNPLDGVINIVDAMLVFACGLMLSVIIHWNVNLDQTANRVDLKSGQDVSQTEDIRNNLIEPEDQGKLYEKMGTVYKDPATGKLFMLTNK